jgi:hypothetical protein
MDGTSSGVLSVSPAVDLPAAGTYASAVMEDSAVLGVVVWDQGQRPPRSRTYWPRGRRSLRVQEWVADRLRGASPFAMAAAGQGRMRP